MSFFDIGKTTQKILSEIQIETWFENETTSTNSIAKEQALQLKAPLKVYLTNHQTAGRGRNQNSWSDSDSGTCLLSSWSFSFQKNPQPILAPLVGLAIYNNLNLYFSGLAFSLKAPNDIFLGKAKLCGILIENIVSRTEGRCIIGIGMNVLNSPIGLDSTCLSQHTAVNELAWKSFLIGLQGDLAYCIKASESEYLKPEECLQLASALQKNPNLKDCLVKVSSKASLVFKNHRVDWQNI